MNWRLNPTPKPHAPQPETDRLLQRGIVDRLFRPIDFILLPLYLAFAAFIGLEIIPPGPFHGHRWITATGFCILMFLWVRIAHLPFPNRRQPIPPGILRVMGLVFWILGAPMLLGKYLDMRGQTPEELLSGSFFWRRHRILHLRLVCRLAPTPVGGKAGSRPLRFLRYDLREISSPQCPECGSPYAMLIRPLFRTHEASINLRATKNISI